MLAFGKILAEKLKATGRFKVLMTRDTDVFVPLGERVAFAERNKANLFIAVHCDYADTGSSANGATIYSLRDSRRRQPAPLRQGRTVAAISCRRTRWTPSRRPAATSTR